MPTSPVSLTVGPDVIKTAKHHLARHVVLVNRSAVPLHITTSTIGITSAQDCTPVKAPPWVHVSPGSFTLRPGSGENIRVTVNAPPSAHTALDLAAIYRAAPTAGSGSGSGMTVSAAVGTRLLLSYGKATATPCVAHQRPTHTASGLAITSPAHHGMPSWVVPGILTLLLLGIVSGVLLARRRRHREDPFEAEYGAMINGHRAPRDRHPSGRHGGRHS